MIIAIVPAPSHSSLVAEGPMGERPACLVRWAHRQDYEPQTLADGTVRTFVPDDWRVPDEDELSTNYERALVLFAPGDPKLGMLRAMEAAFGNDAEASTVRYESSVSEGWLSDRNGDTLADWPVVGPPPGMPVLALPAFALAYLLVQRGPGAEVLVIE